MANKAVAKAQARAKQVKKPPLVVPLANKTGKISFRFDGKNEKAQKVVKAVGAKLVTFVTNETMAAIRTVVVKAIREGIPPYDAAKSIVGVVSKPGATTNEMPGMIGLNNPQILAAFNYKAGLIDIGHNPDTVDRLMAKYVTRKLRERSVVIARHEIMTALNTGAEVGYIQAVKQGALPPEARLEVIVTPDERLCKLCAPLAGKTKKIGEATFPGCPPGPAFHVQCRCTVGIVLAPPEGEE